MYVESRDFLVKWLREQLVGPSTEEDLLFSPLERYPTGVLYPVEADGTGVDPVLSTPDVEVDEADDEAQAEPVRRRRFVPPSSVGFSIFVHGDICLSITATASIYEVGDERGERGRFKPTAYTRRKLPEAACIWSSSSSNREFPSTIWNGRARVEVRARPHKDGLILTVALCNRRKPDLRGKSPRTRNRDLVVNSLFEARLECELEAGELWEYPRVDASLLTDEEQELELQYMEQRIYAVGHGAAANWDVSTGHRARVWSEFMPAVEVPIVTVSTGGDDAALSLQSLAASPRLDELEHFTDRYADWVEEQGRTADRFPIPHQVKTARRIHNRMQIVLDRMREGIELLRTDRLASEAFQIANQAMLDQLIQADRVEDKRIDPESYRWRPFQLAFLLTAIKSTIQEDDKFRDVLDLIWFPTGGGKTEAYLGLIAFLISWRRARHAERGGGTTVLMRYTLRLLALQQSERAARLICALELIRQRRPKQLGETPITVGIWVGKAVCPNRCEQAWEIVEQIRDGRLDARFELVFKQCPWCRTEFDAKNGYDVSPGTFHFLCTNHDCAFGQAAEPLPCNVVDDALYSQPPTLLIGTIDKFARLAWEEKTGAFFGVDFGFRPPELIIQDELHLITGPLGSVAGLYEAGIDTLLTCLGVRPKYVASTATIRRAHEQVKRLYARELAVFPPPGINCNDSYFARTDPKRPGRLYLGYLAPALDQQHSLGPLAAVLLSAPKALFEKDKDREDLLDAWWTQVVYHCSLKSVGHSHNTFVTGVREFGHRLSVEQERARQQDAANGNGARAENGAGLSDRLQNARLAQLTSRGTASGNAETFQRLSMPQAEDACLDAVLATNMVSVGLDVPRLALMIVNGQPLTTAEYIQATSRVGRAEVPGLIVINFYRHQARSLSHYENFRPYHDAFYRFVEPSSVTPHTFQVRTRALHAALVIAIRHACTHLRFNKSAGRFDPDCQKIKAVIAEFKRRCEGAASGRTQAQETASHIDSLVCEWHDEAVRCEHIHKELLYMTYGADRNADRLLHSHGEPHPGLWPTLNSMRNVEGSGLLRVEDWPPDRPPRHGGWN